MRRKRKQYSPEFKAKIALSAVKNVYIITFFAITARYEVHPTVIHTWKRNLPDGVADIFDKGRKRDKQTEAKVDELYRHIGKLKAECDFLSRKISL